MQHVYPSYYTRFSCVADRCRHNCCIGWEIDIDPDTYALYRQINGAFGERLKQGIVHDGAPHFRLDTNERCVFLNQNGLCDIICTLGEDALCDICHDHPRFRTYCGERVHIGLGLCCEAACRLVLGEDAAYYVDETGETVTLPPLPTAKDTRTPHEWAALYRSLERLDPAWDGYLDRLDAQTVFTRPEGLDAELKRLGCYFLYRYPEHPLLATHAVRIIGTLCMSADELHDLCRLYSAEIEYSDENIQTLINKTAEE